MIQLKMDISSSVTVKSRVFGIPIPMTGWNHSGRTVLVKVTSVIRVLRWASSWTRGERLMRHANRAGSLGSLCHMQLTFYIKLSPRLSFRPKWVRSQRKSWIIIIFHPLQTCSLHRLRIRLRGKSSQEFETFVGIVHIFGWISNSITAVEL